MWAIFRVALLVMIRATPSSGSYVTPTGTTWGVPSERRVVKVQRWFSRQKLVVVLVMVLVMGPNVLISP
ncbi:hypothetical protein GCM10009612_27340 [Streptomyces beijiangensis]